MTIIPFCYIKNHLSASLFLAVVRARPPSLFILSNTYSKVYVCVTMCNVHQFETLALSRMFSSFWLLFRACLSFHFLLATIQSILPHIALNSFIHSLFPSIHLFVAYVALKLATEFSAMPTVHMRITCYVQLFIGTRLRKGYKF